MNRLAVARSIFTIVALAANAAAQTNAGTAAPVCGAAANATEAYALRSRVVTGQPYSAEQATQLLRTLADGTHISGPPVKTMYYRDSEGRVRTERSTWNYPGVAETPSPFVSIEISDPVAGYNYYLGLSNHTAIRTPERPARLSEAAGSDDAAAQHDVPEQYRPETCRESLGTKKIEGVSVEGSRTTTTWPVGSLGNDRPIKAVREVWTSPELGIDVLITDSDPRIGDSTTRMTNISRAEPDPALFKPPQDYRITGVGGRTPVQK